MNQANEHSQRYKGSKKHNKKAITRTVIKPGPIPRTNDRDTYLDCFDEQDRLGQPNLDKLSFFSFSAYPGSRA